MTAEPIYVNYGHVDNVEELFLDAYKSIQAVLSNLDEVIGPLRASWSGISEQEYITSQKNWTTDMQNMSDDLTKMSDSLSEMCGNFKMTADNVTFQWTQII